METFVLSAQRRHVSGHKVRHLREEGWVPAVVYGAGQPADMIQVEAKAVEALLDRGGLTHLIELQGLNGGRDRVLIREIQRHPVRRTLLHLDFVRVAAGAKVRVEVPVVLVGTAPVTAGGAVVLQNIDAVEVECLPENLPEHVEVDISRLTDVHARITLADLRLPPGVVLHAERMDAPVVTVTVPRAVLHAEEEEETTGKAAEPEVIKKGKEEKAEE
ncbi:MAG: 50S ribosomal protein L25 [Caldilineales bacterium]|nr:50S ribosomal protein L25 [Caldilineales bacterium]